MSNETGRIITRRQALVVGTIGALGAIAGAGPAAAAEHERAKWIAMWELFVDLDEKFSAACNSEDQAAERAASQATIDLEREIASTPATSIIAVAVKLAIARRVGILDEFMEDGTLQAAYRDTMRLAGLPEAFGELEAA